MSAATPFVGYAVVKYFRLFKDYLIACEYLQIDPTQKYAPEFINDRADTALTLWNEADFYYWQFRKIILWLKENYKTCVGFRYGFARKAKKSTAKKRLVIHTGTVAAKYEKKPPTQANYDGYEKAQDKYMRKISTILLPIAIPILIILLIILLNS
jgi:hypothetical protein